MGYCAPQTPNHGFLDHGCEVHGGIQINLNDYNRAIGEPVATERFYIPQFNLAHYWRRPELNLHPQSFPYQVIGCRDNQGKQSYGYWPYDTRAKSINNRNLIAAAHDFEESGVIKLWCVNDFYDGKRLLEFRLQRDESDQNLNRLDFAPYRCVSGTENQEHVQFADADSSLLELYSWRANGEQDCHLIARTENEICVYNTNDNSFKSVFGNPTDCFVQIPHMHNEIALLDKVGKVWHGEIGCNMVHLEVENIKFIAASDHPRILYAANSEKVWTIDLRDGLVSGKAFYSVPDFDDSSRDSYFYCYEGAFLKPKIHRLCILNGSPQSLLITTSNKFSLVDERMRDLTQLTLAHSIYEGGDFMLSAPSFPDFENSGRVFPVFVLRRTVDPDLHHFSLYQHSSGLQWSSIKPITRMNDPQGDADFLNEHPEHGIRITRQQKWQSFGTGLTTAICCLRDPNAKDSRLIFFRMLGNGTIWSEYSGIDESPDSHKALLNEFKLSLSEVQNIHLEPENDKAIQEETNDPSNIDDVNGFSHLTALNTTDCLSYPKPSPIVESDADRMLSNVVIQCCSDEAFGFRGSLGLSVPNQTADEESSWPKWCKYDCAHVSQTYVALCSLLILGDDLSRVDRISVFKGLRACQSTDGSFRGQIETESDMRFVYCAAAICYILNNFDAIDVNAVLGFIRKCVNYDGGIGQAPSLESHGGSTYCAVASLALLGHLWDESVLSNRQIEKLKKWALRKQEVGFHGRANKPDDTCYGFWIGGTLEILHADSLADREKLRFFTLSTQEDRFGGFGKSDCIIPDALHTCFSISALSILHEPGLRAIFVPLNISKRAAESLNRLSWRVSIP